MCFQVPLWAALALTGVGGATKFLGDRKQQKALESTYSREQMRQKQFDAQANDRFKDSLDSTAQVTDPAAMARAAAAREASYGAVTKPATGGASYLPGTSTDNHVVADAAARAGAASEARTGQFAKALATMGGLGDQMLANNINIGRNAQEIDQISGFRRGSIEALNAELKAAAEKGKTLRAIGGLAQQLGMAALAAGAGGGAAAGAGAGVQAGDGALLSAFGATPFGGSSFAGLAL